MITADNKIIIVMAFMAGAISSKLVVSRQHAGTESPMALLEPVTLTSNHYLSLKVQILQALLVAALTASATYLLLVSYYGEKSGLPPPHVNIVAAASRVYYKLSAHVKTMRRDNIFSIKEEALSPNPAKKPITKNKRVRRKVDSGYVHVKLPQSSS